MGVEGDKAHLDNAHGLTGKRISTVAAWHAEGGTQALRTHRGLSGPDRGENGGRADLVEMVPKEVTLE